MPLVLYVAECRWCGEPIHRSSTTTWKHAADPCAESELRLVLPRISSVRSLPSAED